jgi:hypothetical protein
MWCIVLLGERQRIKFASVLCILSSVHWQAGRGRSSQYRFVSLCRTYGIRHNGPAGKSYVVLNSDGRVHSKSFISGTLEMIKHCKFRKFSL